MFKPQACLIKNNFKIVALKNHSVLPLEHAVEELGIWFTKTIKGKGLQECFCYLNLLYVAIKNAYMSYVYISDTVCQSYDTKGEGPLCLHEQ